MQAHPRSRGENETPDEMAAVMPGSSPLTRRKHARALTGVLLDGLIPAHAGKTNRGRPRRQGIRAHPRSRGENVGANGEMNEPRGSSPLTRGKRFGEDFGGFGWGLIPAHAGKTAMFSTTRPGSGAHPRSRGENVGGGFGGHVMVGSSPLTRGKQSARHPQRRDERLIPAHAGKTRRPSLHP